LNPNRMDMRVASLAVLLVSMGAMAEPERVMLAPYPLEVLVRDLSPKQTASLQPAVRQALVTAGVRPVDAFAVNAALKQLNRTDCSVDDDCLAQYAKLSAALYAIFVGVKADAAGLRFTATARVVRDDGQLVIPPKSLSLEKKAGQTSTAVVEQLVPALLTAMELPKLPATRETRPVEPVRVTPPPETTTLVDAGTPGVPDAGVSLSPPPPPPPEPPLARGLGWAMVGVGAGAAVVGSVLFGVGSGAARSVSDGLVVPGPNETTEQAVRSYETARSLQPAGLTVLGIGGAVALVGAILVAVNPSEGPKVSVMVAPNFGAVTIQGELP
jgi:hypothetical protein